MIGILGSCIGSLCCQNQLGILWAGRDETETAQGFLETAESIYQRYMKEVCLVFFAIVSLKLLVHRLNDDRLGEPLAEGHFHQGGYRGSVCLPGCCLASFCTVSQLICQLAIAIVILHIVLNR